MFPSHRVYPPSDNLFSLGRSSFCRTFWAFAFMYINSIFPFKRGQRFLVVSFDLSLLQVRIPSVGVNTCMTGACPRTRECYMCQNIYTGNSVGRRATLVTSSHLRDYSSLVIGPDTRLAHRDPSFCACNRPQQTRSRKF